MGWRWIFLAPLVLMGIVLFIAIGGAVVLLLWNWLLPPLFEWPRLNFWQALGILALCRILVGGLGGGGLPGYTLRRRMAERWASMTSEERERFRQRMRGRWGFGPPASESKGE